MTHLLLLLTILSPASYNTSINKWPKDNLNSHSDQYPYQGLDLKAVASLVLVVRWLG